MDVRDLLSYASPTPQLKRPLRPLQPLNFYDDADSSDKKKFKFNKDGQSTSNKTSETSVTANSSEHLGYSEVDLDEHTTVGKNEVTDSTVLRLCVLLEKRALANQEARTKFPDQPKRFMQSEVDLQETLEEMQILAANPHLYVVLAQQTRPISLLVGLLSHENTDIALSVIDLLHELLESNGLSEAGLQLVNPFLDLLFSNQLIQSLIQNSSRLDETQTDEADGVHKTLGIVESLLEIRPEMNVTMANQGLFTWLLRRLQRRPVYDKNKLYASELLSILLQMDESNRRQLGEVDGIDILLQQLASYKRHDPTGQEESEYMLNLFDCLCSALMLPENKDRFLKGEGIQLMNLMLREKHMSRDSALRVLDYTFCVVNQSNSSTAKPDSEHVHSVNTIANSTDSLSAVSANCAKFVEVLGLRTIFPLFMHSPIEHSLRTQAKSINKPKIKSISGPTSAEMEEHIINIVAALLRFCSSELKSRVLAKFVENDHEKVDRLIELHLKYSGLVKDVNKKIEVMRNDTKRWAGYDPEEIEEELLLKRLECGLLPLQTLSVIVMDISVNGPPTIYQRILHLFRMRSIQIETVSDVAEEYIQTLGDESTNSEKLRVSDLLKEFNLVAIRTQS